MKKSDWNRGPKSGSKEWLSTRAVNTAHQKLNYQKHYVFNTCIKTRIHTYRICEYKNV
jgi:hypothetical protein